MADTRFHARATCLGQTCLQWQPDGELSAEDRRWVLERLLLADGCASAWGECWVISDDRPLAVMQPS